PKQLAQNHLIASNADVLFSPSLHLDCQRAFRVSPGLRVIADAIVGAVQNVQAAAQKRVVGTVRFLQESDEALRERTGSGAIAHIYQNRCEISQDDAHGAMLRPQRLLTNGQRTFPMTPCLPVLAGLPQNSAERVQALGNVNMPRVQEFLPDGQSAFRQL